MKHHHRSRRADQAAVAARVAVVLGVALAAGLLAMASEPASEWAASGTCPASAANPLAAVL